MKKLVMTTVLLVASVSPAASIAGFKKLLPNGTYQGIMMLDYKCQIKTKWLSATSLKVETTLQYKNSKPSIDTVIFSDAKKADFVSLRLDEASIMAEVSQSKVIHQEEDYEVVRHEQISLDLNDSRQIKGISVDVTDVDGENDPNEAVSITCENIKKIN